MTKMSLGLVALVAMGTAACKDKVPDEYKEYVPEEGIDSVVKSEKSAFNGEGVSVFYEDQKVPDLRKGFEKRAEKAGYELMMTCEDADIVVAGKAPNKIINVSFLPIGERIMANFEMAEVSSIGFPQDRKCVWTEAAKKICEPAAEMCFFDKKK